MKSSKLQTALTLGSMLFLLSACSMEASISSLIEDVKNLQIPGQAHGIVSGASQSQSPTNSTNKYKVSVSAGGIGGSTLSTTSLVHTTAAGYKVYSSVQGAVVSE
jgi:hypothetical protein